MIRRLTLVLAAAVLAGPALADEADIRRNLPQRLPNLPPIESVQPTPMAGLFEVVADGEILYTDALGTFILHGQLLQTHPKLRNLTEERSAALSGFEFATLPFKDAVVWKSGNGKRRIAVFSDPNCGYCKRQEKEFQQIKDLTVYTFMVPILGGDSPQKLRNIWCAKDVTQAWREWMLEGVQAARVMGKCDSPAERNMELARKHRIRGTPAIVFEDGSLSPGMLSADALEERLSGKKS